MKNNSKTIHWFVIINPAAGAAKKRWPKLKAALEEKKISFECQLTAKKGDATSICIEAIAKGFRYIIAVGGDGTNNEVINGICQQDTIPSQEICYTLFPIGTGNDWRKTHGIPTKLGPWILALQKMNTRLQDIGVVDYQREDGKSAQRFFANVAGMAYDAFVVQETEKGKGQLSGKIYYLYMVLKCLFKYKLQKAEVVFDGQKIENSFYTINVGICKYSGGGMQFVPHAIPDDGQFALTLAGPISKLGLVLNTWRFYNGSIGNHSKVDTFLTKEIKVNAIENRKVALEVDGEYLGVTPVRFTLLPQALKVVVP